MCNAKSLAAKVWALHAAQAAVMQADSYCRGSMRPKQPPLPRALPYGLALWCVVTTAFSLAQQSVGIQCIATAAA